MYLLRLALNVTPSLPTRPPDSLSFRQAAPHSARIVFIISDFLKLCKIGFKVKETPPRNQRFRSSRKGWTFCAFSLLFTPSAIRHAVSHGSFFAGSANVPNPSPRTWEGTNLAVITRRIIVHMGQFIIRSDVVIFVHLEILS